ncbi:MAG: glycosyltransferase family 1 protein [Patescibacteria group bacterium]
MTDVYIYDSTASDSLSKVRGIGRYIQILKENFPDYHFIADLEEVPDHSIFINPFFDFLKYPLTLKRVSRKQVAVIHDIIPLKYPKHYPVGIKGGVFKRLNRLALRRYDLILTVSESTKKDLIKKLNIPDKKIQIVYPILSKQFFKQQMVKPTSFKIPIKYFIFVSDATWNKNLVNLAKAIKMGDTPCIFVGKVYKTFLDLNLDEIDHPEQQEIKNFLKLAKGDSRFIFPGYITDEELVYLYKHAVSNILVSRDEGFGYSYFEAAALKTPSVLGDRTVFHETAADTALFARPERPKDISEKLKLIAKDSTLQKELGKKAYKRQSLFSAKKFQQQFKKALENSKFYAI